MIRRRSIQMTQILTYAKKKKLQTNYSLGLSFSVPQK